VCDDDAVLTEGERSTLIERADETPAIHPPGVTEVFHYSEDGTIRRFAPHVPQTNPGQPASVWAIDGEHSPLYWFPRHCPRISVWAGDDEQQALLTEVFETEASRLCAAESGWLERVRDAHLYRYVFDAAAFSPWGEADGQYITHEAVYPERVDRLDDLLALHAAAETELRFTPRLGALMDRILASGLPFSFVRIRDAKR
jgi:hypothetical protein